MVGRRRVGRRRAGRSKEVGKSAEAERTRRVGRSERRETNRPPGWWGPRAAVTEPGCRRSGRGPPPGPSARRPVRCHGRCHGRRERRVGRRGERPGSSSVHRVPRGFRENCRRDGRTRIGGTELPHGGGLVLFGARVGCAGRGNRAARVGRTSRATGAGGADARASQGRGIPPPDARMVNAAKPGSSPRARKPARALSVRAGIPRFSPRSPRRCAHLPHASCARGRRAGPRERVVLRVRARAARARARAIRWRRRSPPTPRDPRGRAS